MFVMYWRINIKRLRDVKKLQTTKSEIISSLNLKALKSYEDKVKIL